MADSPGAVKDLLNRAIADQQAALGDFLRTASELYAVRDQAAELTKVDKVDVSDKAKALVANCNGLLTAGQTVQAAGLDAAAKASAMQTQIQTDPTWQNLLKADFSSLGWGTLQKATQMAGQVTGLVQDLVAVKNRMNDHIAQVNNAKQALSDLVDYAQGRGIKATLSSIGSSWASALSPSLNKAVTILAVGAAVWAFGPSLLARGGRAARKAVS